MESAESQEALEELADVLERLRWLSASFRRLRGDLELTERRIAALAQSIEGAGDNSRLALQKSREGR